MSGYRYAMIFLTASPSVYGSKTQFYYVFENYDVEGVKGSIVMLNLQILLASIQRALTTLVRVVTLH